MTTRTASEHRPGGESKVRTFFMEDYLESIRLERRNLGESGARSLTVAELLQGVGLTRDEIAADLLEISLRNSPNWGRDDLRDAIAAIHPGATRDNVLVTTGTSEALLLLFRHLRPRRLALAMPAFQQLYELPITLGAEIVALPVHWNDAGAPHVDRTEWLDLIRRARPDCLLLNNPHNPSGLVFAPELCEELLAYAETHHIPVIADEHYRFHAGDRELLGPTLYRPHGRVFVTGSFIKCLGCTGLRIGWCVGDRAELAAMQNDKNYTTHTVSPLSEWIGYHVMRSIDTPILAQLRAEWSENRRMLDRFLASSRRLFGRAPAGGFVTCVGVRGASDRRAIAAVAQQMAERHVFLLSLDTMEVGVGVRRDAPALEQGLGFRLGLGVVPGDLREALALAEAAAEAAHARGEL